MKLSGRARLNACLERTGWLAVGEPEFQQLLAELSPMSERQLRRLLRESGMPLSPLVEGVRQSSLDDLERTLCALQEEYARAGTDRRREIRRLVITSRDHARLASKQEAILWMNTWLENPEAFSVWVLLRKRAIDGA